MPTAPSAPAPGGCSGPGINIFFRFNGNGEPYTEDMFGETINGGAQPVEISRSLVPCDYEISGRIGASFLAQFGFSSLDMRKPKPSRTGGGHKTGHR